MTPRARSALALSLLTLALILEGCIAVAVGTAAAAGGASAAVYRRGWYRAAVQSPHYLVDKGLRRTAQRARLIERERTCDGYKSYYLFQDLRDVKVKIKLRASTPDATKVYIRVGFWGDRVSSQELFEGLQQDIAALQK
jgi:hypothetical protein